MTKWKQMGTSEVLNKMICEEGSWFTFPLAQDVWGLGLVVHREKNKRIRKPVFFGYFWVLEKSVAPSMEDTVGLSPANAMNAGIVTSMGFWHDKTWSVIGQELEWDSKHVNWPFLPLLHFDDISKTWHWDLPPKNQDPFNTPSVRRKWQIGDSVYGWKGGQKGHRGHAGQLLKAHRAGLAKVDQFDATSILTLTEQARTMYE